MVPGAFKYENDLLKHYVRVKGWLPLCAERQKRLKKRKPRRRLKYFAFCAVNAVDVLMLDVANIIARSTTGRFDTVYFFDKTADLVAQTKRRIPGSIGFAGNFVETVLTPFDSSDPLATPASDLDTYEVRKRQILQTTKLDFLRAFPFDVLNLDLQDNIFKARDTIPGDVINALRQLCAWQRQPLLSRAGEEPLDGFTLLFTTRVGDAELHKDFAQMLLDRLQTNVAEDASLAGLLKKHRGLEVSQLQEGDFFAFFELGLPKVIANVLIEEDWQIEPVPGLLAFRFTRPGSPPYHIVHFAMDVSRQSPRLDQRAPGTRPPQVTASYQEFARRLFQTRATVVTTATLSGINLKPSLEEIRERRRFYCPDEMAG